jgi:hypothetical protein
VLTRHTKTALRRHDKECRLVTGSGIGVRRRPGDNSTDGHARAEQHARRRVRDRDDHINLLSPHNIGDGGNEARRDADILSTNVVMPYDRAGCAGQPSRNAERHHTPPLPA